MVVMAVKYEIFIYANASGSSSFYWSHPPKEGIGGL